MTSAAPAYHASTRTRQYRNAHVSTQSCSRRNFLLHLRHSQPPPDPDNRTRSILTTELGRSCLREAITKVGTDHPFNLFATVLLPDHWHTVWILPPGDDRYSIRWMRIKEEFTNRGIEKGGSESEQSVSRTKQRRRGVWQPRFWEHTVRDEADLQRCVDYIHWNPRKHQLVKRVRDWQWSSFHRFVEAGQYNLDWGGVDPTPQWNTPEWGE
jgi:putative transposase